MAVDLENIRKFWARVEECVKKHCDISLDGINWIDEFVLLGQTVRDVDSFRKALFGYLKNGEFEPGIVQSIADLTRRLDTLDEKFMKLERWIQGLIAAVIASIIVQILLQFYGGG